MFLEKFYEGQIELPTTVPVVIDENKENFEGPGTSKQSIKRKSSTSTPHEVPVNKKAKSKNGEAAKYCEICLESFPTKVRVY